MKFFFIAGCISAFLSVALGAFGAHGLEGEISERMLEVWKTGVQYQMFHATALFIVAFTIGKFTNMTQFTYAGVMFIIGTLLFSGSLYAMSISGIKVLGAITPLGGVAFLIGWTLLAYGMFKVM